MGVTCPIDNGRNDVTLGRRCHGCGPGITFESESSHSLLCIVLGLHGLC